MISGRAGQSVTLMSCSFALQHKGSYSPRRSWPGATMVSDGVKSSHPHRSTRVPRQRLPPCGWQSEESQWQRRQSSCDGTAVPAAGGSPDGRLKSEWLRQYHTFFSLRMFFHGGHRPTCSLAVPPYWCAWHFSKIASHPVGRDVWSPCQTIFLPHGREPQPTPTTTGIAEHTPYDEMLVRFL